jgi:hypothetical protein
MIAEDIKAALKHHWLFHNWSLFYY